MPRDFKANQILTSQIITSGAISGGKPGLGLIVYTGSISTDDSGGFPASLLADVGSDVYTFFSGSKGSKFSRNTPGNGKTGVVLFGGDVVFSGTMYAERMVVEVDQSTTGSLLVSGSLFVSQSETILGTKTVGTHAAALHLNNSEKESAIVWDDNDAAIWESSGDLYLESNQQILILSGGSKFSPDPDSFTDTNFFVSGSGASRGTSRRGTSTFGGDTVISGTLFVSGNSEPGLTYSGGSISGSIHHTAIGKSYLEAGSNITITSASNGTVTISAPTVQNEWTDEGNILRPADGIAESVGVGGTGGTPSSYDILLSSDGQIKTNNFITASLGFSGSLTRLTNGKSYIEAGTNITVVSSSNGEIKISAPAAMIDGVGSANQVAFFSDVRTIAGDTDFTFDGTDLTVSTANRTGILVDGSADKVLILSGGGAGSYNESAASDVAFYVSGSKGSVALGSSGITLLGGDTVISGSAQIRRGVEANADKGAADFIHFGSSATKEMISSMTSNQQVFILSDTTDGEAAYTDLAFFVSGSKGSRGTSVKGTSLFGGDVVISGTLFGGSPLSIGSDLEVTGSTILAGPVILSGSASTTVTGTMEVTGSMIVSGSLTVSGSSTFIVHGPSIFNGNIESSGFVTASMGLSGSLTRLVDGSSYLRAGSNITIASASNGQVEISSTGITEISEDTSPELGGQLVTGDHKISYGTGDDKSEIDLKYDDSTSHVAIASIRSIDLFLDSNLDSHGTENLRIFNNLEPAASVAASTNTNANAIFRVHETGNVLTKGYVTASMGLSGSLTRLVDGSSYLRAGSGITITSSSNGPVTISQAAGAGDITGVTAGTGLTGGGTSGNVTLNISDSVVATLSGSVFTGDVQVTGTLGAEGDIVASEYIRHSGDTDTHIRFVTNGITFTAGNDAFLSYNLSDSTVFYGESVASSPNHVFRTTGKTTALGISDAQVLVLSGGGANSFNEGSAADVAFYVSGSKSSLERKSSADRGTAVLGGDTVISGTLFVSGANGPGLSYSGGSISGSIHHTAIGRSYLEAGSNITIASASNGTVTISSTASPGTPGGSDTQVQFNNDGSFGGISGATTDGTSITFADSGILVGKDITHAGGDDDTKITFESDQITFTAGNQQMLTLREHTQDVVRVGGDGGDVDFQVSGSGDTHALFVDTSTGRVGMGISAPGSILHIKESAPTVTIQRENNSNNSTIEFKGQAGATANMVHMATTNDLVFSTFDGSDQEEILRLGSHYGVDRRQVIFLSGTGMHQGAMQPQEAVDINFFVSGSAGSRGTSEKGSSVFGGDTVISGTLFVSGAQPPGLTYSGGSISGSIHHTAVGKSYLEAGSNVTIVSSSNGTVTISAAAGGSPGGSNSELQYNNNGSLGGISGATTNGSIVTFGDSGIAVGQDIVHAADSDTMLRFEPDKITIIAGNESLLTLTEDAVQDIVQVGDGGDVDFEVKSNGSVTGLFVQGSTGRVGINTATPDYKLDVAGNIGLNEYIYHNGDANTNIQFEDDTIRLSAGGKECISILEEESTISINNDSEALNTVIRTDTKFAFAAGNPLGAGQDQVLIMSGGGPTSYDEASADDVLFYVSGSRQSKGTQVRGTSLFGGDVVVSGTMNISTAKIQAAFHSTNFTYGTQNGTFQMINTAGGAVTGTLPGSAFIGAGHFLVFKDTGGFAGNSGKGILIKPSAGDKIDGATGGVKIQVNSGSIQLISDGFDHWFIVGRS